MTQSPLAVEELQDPNDITQGGTRETRIYYRPARDHEGNPIWMPTTPLPADPWHMNHYAKKGFKLWPPGEEPGQGELNTLQGQVQELEERATVLKESTAESEAAKEAVELEVKNLEEQAKTLRKAMPAGEIKAKPNAISCPVEGCATVVKTYIGLSRHMDKKHGIK